MTAAKRSATWQFGADSNAPAAMRRCVREQLEGWGIVKSDDLELLVSEVVTNAVRHASSGGELSLEASPTGFRVEVSDRGSGSPRMRAVEPTEPSGRGLLVVDAIADAWGVNSEASGLGHTVWFELPLAGGVLQE